MDAEELIRETMEIANRAISEKMEAALAAALGPGERDKVKVEYNLSDRNNPFTLSGPKELTDKVLADFRSRF